MKLTLNELLLLDDSFTKESPESQFGEKSLRHLGADATVVASPALLLKIGAMLLDVKEENEEIDGIFAEGELWIIREAAISTKVRGQEKVGYGLKIKVYNELLELYRDATKENLVFPPKTRVTNTKSKKKRTLRTKIDKGEKVEDANHKDADKNTDTG